MPYLDAVKDWIIDYDFSYTCDEDANEVYDRIDKEWNPNNRFTIPRLLGNDFPDLMVWIQEQIDDECEDPTETITFPPEPVKDVTRLEKEITETESEITQARKELSELKVEEADIQDRGLFAGIKRFIRNIFRG